jgi:hypothetical protein
MLQQSRTYNRGNINESASSYLGQGCSKAAPIIVAAATIGHLRGSSKKVASK